MYVCWTAPLLITGAAIRNRFGLPAIHLESDSTLCEQFGLCNSICPMNLDVMSGVLNGDISRIECILCGSCIDI
jgi:polyferredoxin